MVGYKVFKPDWTCRGYKFAVGETFTEDETPICCMRGFHFCKDVAGCFNYYDFNSDNKVAEVEALGDIDINKDGNKYSTNKIRIVREISWYEVLDMVNLGKGCTGLHNSGDYNSGFYNVGNYNTGHCNVGDDNSGNCNGGDCNSGGKNSGNYNSGHFNSGVRNSGDGNIGNYNSGSYNSGDWNSGNYNSGNSNSGDYNSGDCNCGDWNKGNFSNGCFNRELPKIFMFDKPSDWTYQDWLNSEARFVLSDCPVDVAEWVRDGEMTDREKEQYPGYSVTGGFLRSAKNEKERQEWWDRLAKEKKDAVMKLPNFDKDIFKEITGIDVRERTKLLWESIIMRV